MSAENEVAMASAAVSCDPVFISIEMSRSKWVIGSHVPTTDKVSIHTIGWGDMTALLALIDRLRTRAGSDLGVDVPVLCCCEAGCEGFGAYRRLTAAGHRVLVIDPASLLANRRAKWAKTDRIDRIDAKSMIRALMAFNRGEHQVLSAVHVLSVEQDDDRRLMLERQRERTTHTNRIKGLLRSPGITGFGPRARDVADRLAGLISGDGRALGPRLGDAIRRELARLQLVMDQLADVEVKRDRIALAKVPGTDARCPDDAMIAALIRVRGVGSNDASVLVREAFWREFRNRREIAAWSGFAPTPWASGTISRDQGVTKTGPASFRGHVIQLTWRWLKWQPYSRLYPNGSTKGRMARLVASAA